MFEQTLIVIDDRNAPIGVLLDVLQETMNCFSCYFDGMAEDSTLSLEYSGHTTEMSEPCAEIVWKSKDAADADNLRELAAFLHGYCGARNIPNIVAVESAAVKNIVYPAMCSECNKTWAECLAADNKHD